MNTIKLRDYQQKAAEYIASKKRALLKAPAGSGKTITMIGAVEVVVHKKPRDLAVDVAILCNTNEQKDQWKDAVNGFPSLVGKVNWLIECYAASPDVSAFDLTIVDECHRVTSPENYATIEKVTGALWMCSATPFGEDYERNDLLKALCCGNLYEVSKAEVAHKMAQGKVMIHADTDLMLAPKIEAEIKLKLRRYRHMEGGDFYNKMWGQAAYRAVQDIGIRDNVTRNDRIVSLNEYYATDSTLTLVNTVEHGQFLETKIPGSILCYSKMGVKKRKAAMDAVRMGDIKRIISTSLADEGLDLPILSVVIMACGGRAENRTEQRAGRVMRQYDGKSFGLIHDFADLFFPLAAKHSRLRQEKYRELGYKFIERNEKGSV